MIIRRTQNARFRSWYSNPLPHDYLCSWSLARKCIQPSRWLCSISESYRSSGFALELAVLHPLILTRISSRLAFNEHIRCKDNLTPTLLPMVYIYPTYILQSITMVRLKVKVGQKGQILIPKIFREEYGIHE